MAQKLSNMPKFKIPIYIDLAFGRRSRLTKSVLRGVYHGKCDYEFWVLNWCLGHELQKKTKKNYPYPQLFFMIPFDLKFDLEVQGRF